MGAAAGEYHPTPFMGNSLDNGPMPGPSMGLPLGIYTNHYGKGSGKGCNPDDPNTNCQYYGMDQVKILIFNLLQSSRQYCFNFLIVHMIEQ